MVGVKPGDRLSMGFINDLLKEMKTPKSAAALRHFIQSAETNYGLLSATIAGAVSRDTLRRACAEAQAVTPKVIGAIIGHYGSESSAATDILRAHVDDLLDAVSAEAGSPLKLPKEMTRKSPAELGSLAEQLPGASPSKARRLKGKIISGFYGNSSKKKGRKKA